jgi:hypothetical protein
MTGPLTGAPLGTALRRTATDGFAHVDEVVEPAFLRQAWREVRDGPMRRMAGTFGAAGVRMEIDGFDVRAPFDAFPSVRALAATLAERVREEGAGVRGLRSWRPNEVGIGVYRPGSVGITAHLDGRWYRRLVAIVTLAGSAPFEVRSGREGEVLGEWNARAGGLTLLRGPGLAGARDGRPFHLVHGPRRGLRCSLAFRMAVDRHPG